MTDVEQIPLMTRKQAVEFLQGRGFPVSLDAINRDPPPPVARWRKRTLLYEPKDLLAWASRRVEVFPQNGR